MQPQSILGSGQCRALAVYMPLLQLRQGGATTKPKYVRSKSAPVKSRGGSLCLLWGPHGHGTNGWHACVDLKYF